MKKRYESIPFVRLASDGFRWPVYQFSPRRSIPLFQTVEALIDRTNWLLRNNDPLGAIKLINYAVLLLPDEPRVWNTRCFVYMAMREYQLALKNIGHVIHLVPGFFAPYVTQGNLQFLLGDAKGGGHSLRWAGILAETDKERAVVFFQFGVWAAAYSENDADSKKLFQEASKLDPGNKKYAFLARVRRVSEAEQEAERQKIVLAR